MAGPAKDSDGQQLPLASSKTFSADNIICFDLCDRNGGIVSLTYITSRFLEGEQRKLGLD